MAQYIISRCGNTNAYNSLGIVGTVEAKGVEAAIEAAQAKFSENYNGQRFEAQLASRASKADKELAFEADLRHEEEERHWAAVAADCRRSR